MAKICTWCGSNQVIKQFYDKPIKLKTSEIISYDECLVCENSWFSAEDIK